MHMKKIVFLIFLFISLSTHAAYLKNVPCQVKQPDGEILNCFVTGDEFYNYLHDAEGYTIVQDQQTGFYVYANKVDNILVPTAHIAGRVSPALIGLKPNVNISAELWLNKREVALQELVELPTKTKGELAATKNLGVLNNLVIFIRFADDTSFVMPYSTVEKIFNDSIDQAYPSMYNYFKTTSYNKLEIVSHFFPAPNQDIILSYQDEYPRSYYLPQTVTNPNGYTSARRREHELLDRAVNSVKSQIPSNIPFDNDGDGNIDNVTFIIRGDKSSWSDLLWPHRWTLTSTQTYIDQKRVYDYIFLLADASDYFTPSTICHEMFHSLGAPDLYRYNAVSPVITPVGQWDLMEQNQNPPQQTSAYLKHKYGLWIDDIPVLTQPGQYTLYPLNSPTSEKVCYRINSPDPNQFYVLEYRKNGGLHENIPGDGLLIYRIDSRFNGNANYNGTNILDEVYLFRREGTYYNNGFLALAHFSAERRRTEFHSTSNPYPFLSDGTKDATFRIDGISTAGDSITFWFNSDQVSIDKYNVHNIQIYPNPVSDYVEIVSFDSELNIKQVEIYDMYGRLIATEMINSNQAKINCSNLVPGMYILQLKDDHTILKTSKIIKQ